MAVPYDNAKDVKEVDLLFAEVLLKHKILKSTNGVTYDTYVPSVHISNLKSAMDEYAQLKNNHA